MKSGNALLPDGELAPCPFCADRLVHIWSPAQGGYSVICGNGCGAEGPVMENEERAAEAWNRRSHICALTEQRDGLERELARVSTNYERLAESVRNAGYEWLLSDADDAAIARSGAK